MQTLYYFLILSFYILHSILAATKIKQSMHLLMSSGTYRLIYNFISVIYLVAILTIYHMLNHKYLFAFEEQDIYGWGLIIIGSILGYISFKSYNLREFLGLTEEASVQELSITGMNKYIRHPLYFSGLIVLWGALLIEPTQSYLGFAIISTIYLFVGTKFEEKKLLLIFGKEYSDYQDEVPMLIPSFKQRKN